MEKILSLKPEGWTVVIESGRIDTTPLITHRFSLNEIEKAYRIFENREDGVIKVAIRSV